MAKAKKASAPAPVADTAASSSDSSTAPPPKLNLDDQNAIRCQLDDAAAEVLRRSGYKEDHTVTSVKITLGAISIALALYAQFGPGKFPNNWTVVLACVLGYLVATAALNVYCYLCEKDNFFIAYAPADPAQKVYVSSHMERYSDLYSLCLRSSVSGPTAREVQLEKSVVAYFHSNGYMAEDAFQHDVLHLLERFQQAPLAAALAKKSN